MKPILFLLKPDFVDPKVQDGQLFYCPHSAMVEGILNYYPQLKDLLDTRYVSFQRPRVPIIELLGENNQLCPVLIVDGKTTDADHFMKFKDFLFTNDKMVISTFFSVKFGVGTWHP
jgi:hypothetical protein